MADQTLGRFIFDFIVNTGGLDDGLEIENPSYPARMPFSSHRPRLQEMSR